MDFTVPAFLTPVTNFIAATVDQLDQMTELAPGLSQPNTQPQSQNPPQPQPQYNPPRLQPLFTYAAAVVSPRGAAGQHQHQHQNNVPFRGSNFQSNTPSPLLMEQQRQAKARQEKAERQLREKAHEKLRQEKAKEEKVRREQQQLRERQQKEREERERREQLEKDRLRRLEFSINDAQDNKPHGMVDESRIQGRTLVPPKTRMTPNLSGVERNELFDCLLSNEDVLRREFDNATLFEDGGSSRMNRGVRGSVRGGIGGVDDGDDDDAKWIFLEIMSIFPEDYVLRMALWENPTTSGVIFRKLDELQSDREREISGIILPKMISYLLEMKGKEGEEAQLKFCEIVSGWWVPPSAAGNASGRGGAGFLFKYFLLASEERRGGPVNEAVCQIAEIDRKGLLVESIVAYCDRLFPLRSVGRFLLVRKVLEIYQRKSSDEYSKVRMLPLLTRWIESLSLDMRDVSSIQEEDKEVLGEKVTKFLCEVIGRCDEQFQAPVNRDHFDRLLVVFDFLRVTFESVIEWVGRISPPRNSSGQIRALLEAYLSVKNCRNFSKNIARTRYVKTRFPTWKLRGDVHESAIIQILFKVWE